MAPQITTKNAELFPRATPLGRAGLLIALSLSASAMTLDKASAQCATNGTNQTCTNSTATNTGGTTAITDTGTSSGLVLTNNALLTSSNTNATIDAYGGSISNSSTISNTSTAGDAIDFHVNGMASQASIFNSGTISALSGPGNTGAGIYNGANGGSVSITNYASGTISGTYAIEHQGVNTVGITNLGQITGYTNALLMANTGGATIDNSGTIQATNGAAINNASGQLTVTNNANGTITGSTSGIIAANGASIINRGTISGTAQYGVSLSANSTLTNYGTLSGGTSAVFLNGGGNTFNIYDSSRFTNGIDYNNTTGNTTNFYTGSYTLGVKKYSLAGNTINLRGTATQLITTGLDGAGNGNIVVVAPQVATTPTINATSAAATISSQIQGVTTAAVNNVIQINTAPETRSRDFRPASGEVAPDFADQIHHAFGEQAMGGLSASALTMLSKQPAQRIDAYGNMIWSRAFGSGRLQPARDNAPGSSSTMMGALLGYDRQVDDMRLGAYAGYAFGTTRMLDGSGTMRSDYYLGGVYARRTFGAYAVTANVSGGFVNNRSERPINNGAEMAMGTFNSAFIAPELAVSRDIALDSVWVMTPTLRARYVGSFLPSYTETGSSQNVRYSSSVAHVFEERAEMRLTHIEKHDRGLISTFYVQTAAIASQPFGTTTLNASLLGTDFTVTNTSMRSTVGAGLGFGFDHQMTEQVSLYGALEGTILSDSTATLIGRSGLKVVF